ncbi:hypothetical protein G4B84_001816, partial [Aspergillus flavus NRRL3357]
MANDSTPNTAAANTPTGEPTPTTQLRPGGAPARVYMNEKIVPYLLEGMKHVTKEHNLAVSTDDRTLRVFFENYGNVEDAVVIKDPKTRLSRGFGFVTFSSDEEAEIAVTNTNEK